jgi:Heterokaryon incompatibility protein (HET)
MSLEQLRATLPPPWEVYRTLQGKLLFMGEDLGDTRWKHPNPGIDSSIYDLTPEEQSSEPKYEALSYAWGSDQKSRLVKVLKSATRNECSEASMTSDTPATLSITDSLWNALRCLRSVSEARILWADAICINQDDDAEKSLQVRRMGDIYHQAYRVIVWLGLEANGSKLAFSAFDHMATKIECDDHMRRLLCCPGNKEIQWITDTSFQLPYGDETMVSIYFLLERPWLDRLWVVQEIHLANSFPGPLTQCGEDTIAFSSLQKAIALIYTKVFTMDPSRSQTIFGDYNLVSPKRDTHFGAVLLQVARSKACRDPR